MAKPRSIYLLLPPPEGRLAVERPPRLYCCERVLPRCRALKSRLIELVEGRLLVVGVVPVEGRVDG